MAILLLYSLIGGLFSLAGGLLLLAIGTKVRQAITTSLLSFAAGAFIATSFTDLIPEAIELSRDAHPVLLSVMIGLIGFFILERLLMRYGFRADKHEHADHTETLPILLVLGDTIHNFLDGIVIAVAYIANPALGLTTTLAVAAHEIPQEIGDFSVLLNQGWSRKKVLAVNILQSLATIPGAMIGLAAGSALTPHLPSFLGVAGGIFLYLGASDLIPELHHRAGHKHVLRVVLPLLAAIAVVTTLVRLTHGG
ncbi:MAG: ZIP family metal transporter [Candidatus Gottesmanbacteria bacterium]|nr:ZIP family metal transporter [Candidatus Gottesmanbacteria bacterium]